MSEIPKVKTIAIRDEKLHLYLKALTKEKKFATIEESVRFLVDYYDTRNVQH
jgi:hypothetical protein